MYGSMYNWGSILGNLGLVGQQVYDAFTGTPNNSIYYTSYGVGNTPYVQQQSPNLGATGTNWSTIILIALGAYILYRVV
jgi:hypothetical protein